MEPWEPQTLCAGLHTEERGVVQTEKGWKADRPFGVPHLFGDYVLPVTTRCELDYRSPFV